jgi:2,3-bisphosphoglycerate-independent phosphoglycerate mutase
MKPNEHFSGRGHLRHLCKDCHKLGPDELAFRQAVRGMDRMVQCETGRVRRSQWNNLARFLRHPNERVRRYAEDLAALDILPREQVDDDSPDVRSMSEADHDFGVGL